MAKIEKEIKSRKSWEIVVIQYTDGTGELQRKNDGFSSYELLGMVEHAKHEILAQLKGDIKPDIIKREVIQ